MVWHGIQVALTGLAFLSDFAASPRFEALRASTPRLEFVGGRSDGGAQLGMPVILPSEFVPRAIPRVLPLLGPPTTADAQAPSPPSRPSGPPVSLVGLWELAQRSHPVLRLLPASCFPANATSKGGARRSFAHDVDHDKRMEVLARIRSGYFDYLCLLQEDAVIEAFLAKLKQPSRSKIVTVSAHFDSPVAHADRLSQEVLLADVQAQRRKTQLSMKAVWSKLAHDVGVPELPQPAGVTDAMQPLPDWTLVEVEKQLRHHSSLRQSVAEAEAARGEMMRLRTSVLPGPRPTGKGSHESVTFNLAVRKQTLIRAAEIEYAQAMAKIRARELKLEGEAREAWSRYSLARTNLKRINQESLPRLLERTALIQQACADSVVYAGEVFQAELALFRGQMEQSRERRDLWRAVADLQGLMQVGLSEDGAPR